MATYSEGLKSRGQFLEKYLSPLVILSMEKTKVAVVISELKSVSRLKIFPETGPRCLTTKL